MNILHPAWRFILALRASEIDPHAESLPQDGGCQTWNKTSRLLSDIVYENYEYGQIGSLGDSLEYKHLVSAYRFFKLKTYRVYAETYLLAGGDEAWLASALNIERGVLDAYKNAFFDVSVFKDGIDKLSYIDAISDYRERETKKEWTKGADYIKWQMGFRVGIDVKNILSSLLADVYYKHKQSPDNKEAAKLCDVASKIGKELMGNKDADDLKNKIEQILSLDVKRFKYKTFEEFNNEPDAGGS
jgi:hypothetical protein